MTQPREFTCADCGIDVVQIVPISANDNPVCLTCQWLRDVEDPAEREELRKFLQSTGALQ